MKQSEPQLHALLSEGNTCVVQQFLKQNSLSILELERVQNSINSFLLSCLSTCLLLLFLLFSTHVLDLLPKLHSKEFNVFRHIRTKIGQNYLVLRMVDFEKIGQNIRGLFSHVYLLPYLAVAFRIVILCLGRKSL